MKSPLDAGLAIGINVIHHILGTPVSRQPDVCLGNPCHIVWYILLYNTYFMSLGHQCPASHMSASGIPVTSYSTYSLTLNIINMLDYIFGTPVSRQPDATCAHEPSWFWPLNQTCVFWTCLRDQKTYSLSEEAMANREISRFHEPL